MRAERGMSIRDLADKARVSPTSVFNLEHKKRRPHAVTLYKISEALGCDVRELEEPTVTLKVSELPRLLELMSK